MLSIYFFYFLASLLSSEITGVPFPVYCKACNAPACGIHMYVVVPRAEANVAMMLRYVATG